MGVYGHKRGHLCLTNSNRKVCGFGTTCGHVSTTRDSFIFREKFIAKLSFYHGKFVAIRIV